ncbi:MAG TPA: GNAT family N-acetyltransferase [Tepidisphaeraceae bacterium]|jgi:hypothetical protein|nr:GNAT family N-acetyltransferase [Tepidisphaeraceae bacterium]
MILQSFESAAEFREKALPWLLQHEAENCTILGVLNYPEVQRWIVWDGEKPAGIAVHGAGRNVVLYFMCSEAAAEILGREAKRWSRVAGVYAPAGAARVFQSAYAEVTGRKSTLHMRLAVHRLERVQDLASQAKGSLHQAMEEDLDLLAGWCDEFARYIGEPLADPVEHARGMIAQRRVFLWKDGGRAVSTAAWAGPTPNGIRINQVYTPPAIRNRGYASALVAALSRRLLDEGRKFCFLNTDLNNPTSNNIYAKIGYVRVADFATYRFD